MKEPRTKVGFQRSPWISKKYPGWNQLFTIVSIFLILVFISSCGGIKTEIPKPSEEIQPTHLPRITQTVTQKQTSPTQIPTKTVLQPKLPAGIRPWYPIQIPRTMHTATLLPSGKILIVGGSVESDDFAADNEIIDPYSGKTRWAAPLHTLRHGHTATLLPDGRVLIVGGYNLPQQWLTDAEIYDPSTDTWTISQPLYPHGVGHTSTLMSDGRVLVVGGCIGSGVCTEKVEIFNPADNFWWEAAPLTSDLASHIAQPLEDGRVLIAGGSGDNEVPVSSAGMVYDPNTNTWQATHPMIAPRHLPESVRLLNGKVLVAGGIIVGDPSNSQLTAIVEIFDPSTNTWSRAADLNFARYEFVLTLLKDGRVLAIDGANRWDTQWEQNTYISEIELYDPEKDQWSMIGSLPQPTANATGILLSNNTVWVAGGQNDVRGMSIPPETWLIVPPNP